MNASVSRGTGRGTLWLMLAGMLWGTIGIASQAISAANSTNPLTLSCFRLLIAAPLLLAAGWRLLGRQMWSASRRNFGLMIVIGLLIAIYQSLYFAAIPAAGITIATMISTCGTPLLVTLWTIARERQWPHRLTLFSIALALLGTVLLIGGNLSADQHPALLLGVAFATASACGYAAVIVMGRSLTQHCHPLQVTAIGFTSGAALLCVLALANGFALTYSAQGWTLILYIGVISALAYGLFLIGVRTTPAPIASVLILLEPLVAAVLAWLLFGEKFSALGVAGSVMLLAGIYLLSIQQN